MTGANPTSRRTGLLRYSFGGALCLLALVNLTTGSPWFLALGIAATSGIILLGQRRILRSGVTRSGNELTCRYVPCFEGNAYSALVLIPLIGVAMFGAGCAPGYPAWMRYGGLVLLIGVVPLALYGIVRMWLRSLLVIAPSILTVRLVERGSASLEIGRELIESIEPTTVAVAANADSRQIAITYRANDVDAHDVRTVVIGLRLTVPPIALLNALTTWQRGGGDDTELSDRVERALRGRE